MACVSDPRLEPEISDNIPHQCIYPQFPSVSNISYDSSSTRQGEVVRIFTSYSGMNLKPLLSEFLICVCLSSRERVCCMHAFWLYHSMGEGKHWQLHFKSWARVNEGLKKESKRVKAHLGLHSSISKCVLWCFYTVKYHVFQYRNIYWFTRTA